MRCAQNSRVQRVDCGGIVMFKGLLFFVKFSWRHEKRYLVYQVFNQFVAAMIPILAVVMPRFIINELMGQQRMPQIMLYIGLLVGGTFAASALGNWLTWTGFTYRIKIAQDFAAFMHQKTTTADYADIESSRFLEMKEKAEKFLFGNWHGFSYVLDRAIAIIGKTFTLVGVVAVIASLNPLLVLLFAGLVLLSSGIEARVQRRQTSMRIAQTSNERRVMYYGQVLEDFAYGKEVRINSLGAWLMHREHQHWAHSYATYKKSNALGIVSGVFGSFTSLAQQLAAYAYLVAQVLRHAMPIGDFSMYVGGVAAFSGAMRDVMQNVVEVSEYRQYYEAMEAYLDIPAKMRDNAHLPIPAGGHRMTFCNVSFSYPGQAGYALKDINLTLEPGRTLAIVGENGSGKTSLVKLLCRIYDPTEGVILCDGVDIRDIDYEQYMSLFATVFQDYKLYALSLKDNVALAKSDTTADAEVEAALRKAGFVEKLESLPGGVHTLVYRNFDGEGFEPSGGEGQKIALARALFKGAPIVILDEPTAALDPRAEHEIYQHFNALVRGKTAVYISHRLSSARFCDEIVVLKAGSVAERGTHAELMARTGAYAELFDMQAQYYVDGAPHDHPAGGRGNAQDFPETP